MKDANKVYLAGMAKLGRRTVKEKFAYLNFEVQGIPVVVSFGGSKYSPDKVPSFDKEEVPVQIGGDAFIQDNEGKWEIKAKDSDFFVPNQVMPMAFAQVRGKVLRAETDREGSMWVEIGSSYYSKNPTTGEGGWKDRIIRVNLDKEGDPSGLEGRRMSVIGKLGMNPLHVVAMDSILI